MGFSRQGYWSGLPFPSPGDLPNSGIEPRSPALQADALTSEPHQGRVFLGVCKFPNQIPDTYSSYCEVNWNLLSCVRLFATPWTAACRASLSFTIFWSLLKFMSIESVMLFNHLILRHPLLLFPSIFPIVRVFPNESALLTRWLKYWRFNCSISPSSQYSGLISFRIDWFDLLAVQGLSRIFSSTTILKHQFFTARTSLWSNSHICMPMWKTWLHNSDYITLTT